MVLFFSVKTYFACLCCVVVASLRVQNVMYIIMAGWSNRCHQSTHGPSLSRAHNGWWGLSSQHYLVQCFLCSLCSMTFSTQQWQPVWVGCMPVNTDDCTSMNRGSSQNYRNSNNFISQRNLFLNAVACYREMLHLKFSIQHCTPNNWFIWHGCWIFRPFKV